MNTTRAEIAAALSTIPKVKGHARRPAALRKGDAYPLVDALLRGPGSAFQTRWRVLLILGGDEFEAMDQLDALVPAVCDAVSEVLYVDSARPIAVPTEAGDLFAAEFIARSE